MSVVPSMGCMYSNTAANFWRCDSKIKYNGIVKSSEKKGAGERVIKHQLWYLVPGKRCICLNSDLHIRVSVCGVYKFAFKGEMCCLSCVISVIVKRFLDAVCSLLHDIPLSIYPDHVYSHIYSCLDISRSTSCIYP